MAAIDDSLDRYRNPREAMARGLDVTERMQAVPDLAVNTAQGRAARGIARPTLQTMQALPADEVRLGIGDPAKSASRLGRVAGAIGGVIPAVAGGAAYDFANQALADNSAQGQVGAAGMPGTSPAVQQIPLDPNLKAPAAVPGSFFTGSELGRNVGNSINALGAGSAAGAMVRGLSAADTLRAGSGLQRLAQVGAGAAQGVAASRTPAPDIAMSTAQASTPGATANPAIGPQQPGPSANPAIGPQQAPPAATDGIVFKNGNAYSGGIIKGDIASIRDNGVDRAPRGGSLGINGGPGVAAIEQRAADINRQSVAIRDDQQRQQDPNYAAQGSTIGIGQSGGFGLLDNSVRRERELRMAADESKSGAQDLSNYLVGTNQRAIATDRNTADAARDSTAAQTTRRGQDIVAKSQAANNDASRDVAALQGDTQLGVAGLQGNAQRDVAAMGGDARISAAEAKANQTKYTAINLPDTLAPDGMTVMKGGQVLVGANGETVQPGQSAGINADPKALAIKNNTKLSDAEKRAQLVSLGYK